MPPASQTPASKTPASVAMGELRPGSHGVISAVIDRQTVDPIARRMRDLGFVPGEAVRLVTRGPLGGEPLLVQIGYTRFALRRSEAARVQVIISEPVAVAVGVVGQRAAEQGA